MPGERMWHNRMTNRVGVHPDHGKLRRNQRWSRQLGNLGQLRGAVEGKTLETRPAADWTHPSRRPVRGAIMIGGQRIRVGLGCYCPTSRACSCSASCSACRASSTVSSAAGSASSRSSGIGTPLRTDRP